jgi:hypothetical protein
MVKRAVRPFRAARERLAAATGRVDTAPGRQAQVDWGSPGAAIGGQRVRGQRCGMGLGYARRLDVECPRAPTLGRLLVCHQPAGAWCGGRTAESLSDTPTPVGRQRDGDGRVIEGPPQCWEFAHDDGVTPRRCRPSRAQTPGKGAAGLKEVQRRFVMGRPLPAGDALNPMAPAWVTPVAAPRRQGTSVRHPAAACLEERRRPHHGHPPYRRATVRCRRVARAGLGTVETNRAAVPPAAVGRTGAVHGSPEGALQISPQGPLIATPPGPTARSNGAWIPCPTRRSGGTVRSRRPPRAPRRRWR